MTQETPPRPPRRWLRIALWALAVVTVLAAAVLAVAVSVLRASLPATDGTITLDGLAAPVKVERDELGVPIVRAQNRLDVAFGIGFVHAQERYFQMDLTRRSAAGELSALFGSAALDFDRDRRRHRARAVAEQVIAATSAEHRALIDHYTAGVNAGLHALDARPFEYQLLREDPRPWTPVDTALCLLAMFFDLQDEDAAFDLRRGVMQAALPPELLAWITAPGTARWDAPIDQSSVAYPAMPGPEIVHLGQMPAWSGLRQGLAAAVSPPTMHPGSNSWAVAADRSAHGGAIVADDMHLSLRLPTIWFRASMRWSDETGERRLDGLTLPGGGPGLVVGSNGRVAWAFTNSYIDLTDAIVIEPDPADATRYRVPGGSEPYIEHRERIEVKGAEPVDHMVRWTKHGPLAGEGSARPIAVRWAGHDPTAINFAIFDLQLADGLDTALAIGNRAGVPTQNLLVADHAGRIGWSLMGFVPDRPGSLVPLSVADAGERPARLEGSLYPRVVDPPEGLLWTANARIVGGEMFARLGNGGYDLGARQQQIRDALRAEPRHDEDTLHGIQLDDRALLLTPWRDHLLALLEGDADPGRAAVRGLLVDSWTGRATPDSVGYRLTRAFRFALAEAVFGAITLPCLAVDAEFVYEEEMFEAPLWQMVKEEPAHLLHPRHASWVAWQQAVLDGVIAELITPAAADGKAGTAAAADTTQPALSADAITAALARRTWGEANTVNIVHPLARAVPQLRRFLSAPVRPQHGDNDMPRVARPDGGQSQRMVVSPGREERGYLVIAGGQSGHPLSTHFIEQFDEWLDGKTLPFLPGKPSHTLTLAPPK